MARAVLFAPLVVALSAVTVRWAEATEGPLPEAGDIQAMTAAYRDDERNESREFQVPREHWRPILSALLPADRDPRPANWESLGSLEVIKRDGAPLHMSLFAVGKGPGAFATGTTPDRRVYYRGGKTVDLVRSLRAAYVAAQRGDDTIRGRGRARTSIPEPELRLPSGPPPGHWTDPVEGSRWEERRRRIGEELSGRSESGPFLCRLRRAPGATGSGKPDLEVEVRNASDARVVLRDFTELLDHLTFILRGPGGEVVSSFCYVDVRSGLRLGSPPAVVFGPGEVRVDPIYLSVAANHGYRPLRPGRYSIEAVFDAVTGEGAGRGRRVLARSDQLPVFVGKP
jgi:hypothetical protein